MICTASGIKIKHLSTPAALMGVHYVLGSCSRYRVTVILIVNRRTDELRRRGGIFYIGLTLGSLTAGLIQSPASANLQITYTPPKAEGHNA